jgi:hypothetical protein
MTVTQLEKWLSLFPSPDKTKVVFMVPGEAGRADTELPVLDVNSEWHNGVVCVLYPEVCQFHKDFKFPADEC